MNKKSRKPDIKAIVFDAGGVLILEDKEKILKSGINTKKLWAEYHRPSIYNKVNQGKLRLNQLFRIMALRRNLTYKEIEDLRFYILEARILNRDLLKTANKLKSRGYKIGICSNNPDEVFRKWEKRFKFTKNFDVVVVSARVKMIKPNKNIYLYMLKKLDVKPKDTIFIDDLLKNVKGARKAGMKALRFISNKNTENKLKELL